MFFLLSVNYKSVVFLWICKKRPHRRCLALWSALWVCHKVNEGSSNGWVWRILHHWRQLKGCSDVQDPPDISVWRTGDIRRRRMTQTDWLVWMVWKELHVASGGFLTLRNTHCGSSQLQFNVTSNSVLLFFFCRFSAVYESSLSQFNNSNFIIIVVQNNLLVWYISYRSATKNYFHF